METTPQTSVVDAARQAMGPVGVCLPVSFAGVPHAVRVDPVEQPKGDCRLTAPGNAHDRSSPGLLKAESHSSWMGG